MDPRNFSKSEAIRFGWETTKKNLGFFIPLVLVVAAVQIIFSFLSGQLNPNDDTTINFIVSLVSWAVTSLLAIGQLKIVLKFVDGQKASLPELFSYYKYLLNYIVGSILFGLIIAVGFILLIIPGIILSVKLGFYSYYIVDKGLGPIGALKASWGATKGISWNLFLLGLLLGLINVAGILLLVVGLLVTIPATALAHAYVYRKVSK